MKNPSIFLTEPSITFVALDLMEMRLRILGEKNPTTSPCRPIPSVISTCPRRHTRHMAASFGGIGVPQRQQAIIPNEAITKQEESHTSSFRSFPHSNTDLHLFFWFDVQK
jgi:hypothetical protein